ncbi:MAG: P-II family nitrogen regulator [Dehalococcoidia bacterium]|nr:P-II family nitrogen regulator [Dehalococcoidia bacterium]
MKKVEAIIREEKLDDVKSALEARGFLGMTVTEVSGRGRQKGIRLQWRAGSYQVDLLPKLKLEVVVDDKDSESVVDAICETACTGKAGDGKIFIYPVADVVRVRTRERGIEAI